MSTGTPGPRERAGEALRDAMRRRDRPAVTALRSALAAIGNAEAVDVGDPAAAVTPSSEHVAGSAAGLGAAEVPRRDLDEEAVAAIIRHEARERLTVAATLDGGPHAQRADLLRTEAGVLLDLLDEARRPAP